MVDESLEGDDKGGGIPPITKKILSLGLGAFFLGEDYIRRAVKDAKLPRDIGKSIAQNATKGKDELFGYVARELSNFLRQMDVQAELSNFVGKHKIKVTTEIEFIPRNGSSASAADPSSEEKPLPVDDPASPDDSSFEEE
jgi:hypothetical protein